MKKRQRRPGTELKNQESEALDSLNAQVRSSRKGSDLIRRAMEANLESTSRKKRSREVPASAGFKRTV